MSKTNEDYYADAMAERRGMLDAFDKAAEEKNFPEMLKVLDYFKYEESEETYDSLVARYLDLKKEEKFLTEEQTI